MREVAGRRYGRNPAEIAPHLVLLAGNFELLLRLELNTREYIMSRLKQAGPSLMLLKREEEMSLEWCLSIYKRTDLDVRQLSGAAHTLRSESGRQQGRNCESVRTDWLRPRPSPRRTRSKAVETVRNRRSNPHRSGGLKARQVVGLIAIPGRTLEILPKIDGDDPPCVRR